MVPLLESGWFSLTINPLFCPELVLGHARDSVLFAAVDVSTGWWFIEKNTSIFSIRYKVWIGSVNSGRIICNTMKLLPPCWLRRLSGLYRPVLVGVFTSYAYPIDVLSRPISRFCVRRPNTLRNKSLTGLHNLTVFSTNKFSTSWTF